MTMMDLELRRKILVQRILQVEDEKLLADLEALLGGPATYPISDEQLQGLNEQLEEYLSGRAETFTWEEVKARVAKRRS